MIELAMLQKKVKLRLNKEQLAAIGTILQSYLGSSPITDIDSKAVVFLLWEIYENKLRKKTMSLSQEIGLSLDLPHAWALMVMFQEMDLAPWPYENNVANYIISEIDHQTA